MILSDTLDVGFDETHEEQIYLDLSSNPPLLPSPTIEEEPEKQMLQAPSPGEIITDLLGLFVSWISQAFVKSRSF